jgi:hypothetical protein
MGRRDAQQVALRMTWGAPSMEARPGRPSDFEARRCPHMLFSSGHARLGYVAAKRPVVIAEAAACGELC